MADKTITITIPSAKVAKALEGFLAIYPNSEMTEDEEPINKYSDAQWVNEKIRRIIIRDVKRGLQMIADKQAQIAEDNELVI